MKGKISFTLIFVVVLSVITSTVSVFSQSGDNNVPQEHKYVVTITYGWQGGGEQIATEKYTIFSTSASEAETKATQQWEAMKKSHWLFKFANAERIDEPVQAVSPQSIGYIKVINANPRVASISDSRYDIEKVFVKTAASSEWDNRDYLGTRITRDNSTSIALSSGIYDIRVVLLRNYFMPNVGSASEYVTVESRNVPIREGMVTEITMASGRLSISQPKKE